MSVMSAVKGLSVKTANAFPLATNQDARFVPKTVPLNVLNAKMLLILSLKAVNVLMV